MLKIENLAVSIESKSLLSDISFELELGGYLGILGANGAGKSTLLKAIMGIHAAKSGHASIDNLNLLDLPQKQRAQHVAYLSQSLNHQIEFRVDEFIKMARYPYHHGFTEWNTDDQQAFDKAVTITQIQNFLRRSIHSLSGGEQQRVMIAAAVCQDTPILLLDEPTSYLDPYHQVEVHHLIRQLNVEHNKTVIEVTHDLSHAVQDCKQILALKEGKRLWHGPAADILQTAELKHIYGQEFVFVSHPQTGKPVALPLEHH